MSATPTKAMRSAAAVSRKFSIGDVELIALSDGFLVMDKDFIGAPEHPTAAHDLLADDHDDMVMPIGCFLVVGEKTVLVDLGYGPRVTAANATGGNLLRQLRGVGVEPEDIDIVALSHLHPDHIGWLGDEHGVPVFSNAQVLFGAGDWEYFMDSGRANLPLEPHIRATLETLVKHDRVTLLSSDCSVSTDVTRFAAPGHTPGHSIFAVVNGPDRAVLFGDALYCVEQMTELDWSVVTDVDPRQARATRSKFVRSLDEAGGLALGCHFPDLLAHQVLVSSID